MKQISEQTREKMRNIHLGKHLSKETKIKISEKHKGNHHSPNTEFKKGSKPPQTGIGLPQIREENHYKWIGGTHMTARRMAFRYGFNMTKCQGCNKENTKTHVHHIDENEHNNKLENLRILCPKCHNNLHGIGIGTRFEKGHKCSNTIRNKISIANKGHTAWNKGLTKEDYIKRKEVK